MSSERLNELRRKKAAANRARLEELRAKKAKTDALDPLSGKGPVERAVIGAGGAFKEMATGIAQASWPGQLFYGPQLERSVVEQRKIDKAGGLSEDPYATAGNIGTKILSSIPAAAVPGANTAMGAALTGSMIGMTEPTAGDESRAKNMALAGAMGLGGQQVGKHLLEKPIQALTRRSAAMASDPAWQTLQQGKKLGFRVNPSQAHPTIKNRFFEGWAGKITTGQSVSQYNQQVTNNIAKRAIGMTEDTPLTIAGIKSVRDGAGKAYQKIAQIKDRFSVDDVFIAELDDITRSARELHKDFPAFRSKDLEIEKVVDSILTDDMSAKNAVEVVKRLRDEATALFRSSDLNPNTAQRALAFANKKAAQALDNLIGRNLERLGKPQLLDEWHSARELIAKTHQIERAFNEGSGNVIANKIARSYSKGDPLSGELEDLAKFSLRFDRATQEIKSSMPGISPLDVGATMIAASAQNPAFNPKALIGAMFARPLVRGMITSGPYQRAFVNPGSGPAGLAAAMQRIQQVAGPATAAASPDLIEAMR